MHGKHLLKIRTFKNKVMQRTFIESASEQAYARECGQAEKVREAPRVWQLATHTASFWHSLVRLNTTMIRMHTQQTAKHSPSAKKVNKQGRNEMRINDIINFFLEFIISLGVHDDLENKKKMYKQLEREGEEAKLQSMHNHHQSLFSVLMQTMISIKNYNNSRSGALSVKNVKM
jgi:hypothetical protein